MIKTLTRLTLILSLLVFSFGQDSVDVTFFYYPDDNPTTVHIPGEFNGWNPSSAASQMQYNPGDHSWSKTIRLRVGGPNPLPNPGKSVAGAYQYKFHDGDWFQDPLNPLRNQLDNDNTYLHINDPTLHLLLPNEMPASGVVRTRNPVITAYIFPSTNAEVDPSSISLTVGDSTYTGLDGSYDPISNRMTFLVPQSLADGEHDLELSAAIVGGTPVSMSTSFTVRADLLQFTTLPASTRKTEWRIRGIINQADGNPNPGVNTLELSRPDTSWMISVADGHIDTTISLLPGSNTFTMKWNDGGNEVVSNPLVIEQREYRAPTARIQMFKGGNLMIISAGTSTDPQGDSLSYRWYEAPDNPQSLGIEGLTDLQVNPSVPSVPGDYFLTLEVEDEEGLKNTITNYFTLGSDGSSVKVAGYEDNPQWVKNSRMYLLFFKAFTPEGTIAAAIPKLEYIKNMGFNTIWVLPVMEIPGDVDNQINIGYYIEDLMNVESSYGTNEDYKAFVDSAHAYGLKVIQDVTPNHTGKVHAFAKEAKLHGDLSQYWDYYQTQHIPHNTNGLNDCTTPEGIYYYCGFSDALLNWDWRDVDAREYMIGVYEHWVKEYGIDGYRFDVYWGPSRKYGEANMGVPLREALKRIKPDIMLLGEDDGVGVGTEYLYADRGGGLDVSYDFHTYFGSIRDFGFNSTAINTLHDKLDNGGFHPGENSYYLRFMESQDEDRIAYKYNSFQKTMPVAAAIFMAPGIPMLTNGQEVGWGLGMGNPYEPDLNDRRRGIINWEFSGRNLLTPHYQKLAQIRGQFPAFSQHRKDTNADGWVDGSDESDFDRVETGNGIVYAYLRPYIGSNGLAVMNFSSTAQTAILDLSNANLKLETDGNTYWVNNHYDGVSESISIDSLSRFKVELPPYGSAIYTISDGEEMVELPNLPGITSTNEVETKPRQAVLHKIYPNPFNPSTTISFSLPESGQASLRIYDLKGRLLWTGMQEEFLPSGEHQIMWQGMDNAGNHAPTGIYFVEFETTAVRQVQKITLLR